MVFDSLDRIARWKGLCRNLDTAIDWLQKTNISELSDLKPGRYPVDENRVFVLAQAAETYARSQAKWEYHRHYLDLQLLLEGAETIGFQPINDLDNQEWADDRDIGFCPDNQKGFFVPLKPGEFVLCFPEDGHMPLLCQQEPQKIKKLVVKILMS